MIESKLGRQPGPRSNFFTLTKPLPAYTENAPALLYWWKGVLHLNHVKQNKVQSTTGVYNFGTVSNLRSL